MLATITDVEVLKMKPYFKDTVPKPAEVGFGAFALILDAPDGNGGEAPQLCMCNGSFYETVDGRRPIYL